MRAVRRLTDAQRERAARIELRLFGGTHSGIDDPGLGAITRITEAEAIAVALGLQDLTRAEASAARSFRVTWIQDRWAGARAGADEVATTAVAAIAAVAGHVGCDASSQS